MKVMVTMNLATDLDLANKAYGKVVEIALDPRKHPLQINTMIVLQYSPAFILVRINQMCAM